MTSRSTAFLPDDGAHPDRIRKLRRRVLVPLTAAGLAYAAVTAVQIRAWLGGR